MKSRYVKEDTGAFFDCRSCDQKRIRYDLRSPVRAGKCPLCGKKRAEPNFAYRLHNIRDTYNDKIISDARRNISPTVEQQTAFNFLMEALSDCGEVNLALFFRDGELMGVNGDEVKRLYRGKDVTAAHEKNDYSPVTNMGQVCVTLVSNLAIVGGVGDDLMIEYHG